MDGGHQQSGGRAFPGGLALLTGGLDSILFWLFVGLIIRNAVSVPPGVSQLILNFAISLCYILVGVLDVSVSSNLDAPRCGRCICCRMKTGDNRLSCGWWSCG
jgi:hypothetical protein